MIGRRVKIKMIGKTVLFGVIIDKVRGAGNGKEYDYMPVDYYLVELDSESVEKGYYPIQTIRADRPREDRWEIADPDIHDHNYGKTDNPNNP